MSNQNSTIVLRPTSVQEPLSPTFPSSELLHYGGSAAAIILAVAFLLRAVGEMIEKLVPVMLRAQNPDQNPSSPPSSETEQSNPPTSSAKQ